MTTQESSTIVRDAAQAFQRVAARDAQTIDALVTQFEAAPIPAAEAVLLLADLEIYRRRLMRRVEACTTLISTSAQRAACGAAECGR